MTRQIDWSWGQHVKSVPQQGERELKACQALTNDNPFLAGAKLRLVKFGKCRNVLFVEPVLGPQFYIFLFSPEHRNRDRFCGREPRCRTGGGPYSEHPRDRGSILVGVDESWANVCCFRRIRD
jgi:hypothetical protein